MCLYSDGAFTSRRAARRRMLTFRQPGSRSIVRASSRMCWTRGECWPGAAMLLSCSRASDMGSSPSGVFMMLVTNRRVAPKTAMRADFGETGPATETLVALGLVAQVEFAAGDVVRRDHHVVVLQGRQPRLQRQLVGLLDVG